MPMIIPSLLIRVFPNQNPRATITRANRARKVGTTDKTVFEIPVMLELSRTSWIVGIATAEMTIITITIEITKSTGFTAPLKPLL